MDEERPALAELKRIFGEYSAQVEDTPTGGKQYCVMLALTDSMKDDIERKNDDERAEAMFGMINPFALAMDIPAYSLSGYFFENMNLGVPLMYIYFDPEQLETPSVLAKLSAYDLKNPPFELKGNFAELMEYHSKIRRLYPSEQQDMIGRNSGSDWRWNNEMDALQTTNKTKYARAFIEFLNKELGLTGSDILTLPPAGDGFITIPKSLIDKKFDEIAALSLERFFVQSPETHRS